MKNKLQSTRKTIQYLMLGILAALLVACGGSPKDKLAGRWQDDRTGKSFLEFFPDGTMTMQDTEKVLNGSDTVSGTWMILDDGRLKMTFSAMGMSNSQAVKFSMPSKDKMQYEVSGSTESFTRTKP